MRILITPSNPQYSFVLLDTETERVHRIESTEAERDVGADRTRPSHRPFGISWDSEVVYAANRRNLCAYNEDLSLAFKVPACLDQNTHQIAVWDEWLIAAMTSIDCVKFLNLEKGECRFFHPSTGWHSKAPAFREGEEIHHINSVTAKGSLIYINLHNRGFRTRQVVVLDMTTEKAEWIVDTGTYASHGLMITKEGIGTLDTGGQKNFSLGKSRFGFDCPEDHFCRGLCGEPNHYAVAHFLKSSRRYRGEGGATIKVIKESLLAKSIFIDDIGAVNDMRRLDGQDDCHHNQSEAPICF